MRFLWSRFLIKCLLFLKRFRPPIQTVSVMLTFFLAMVLYPEALRKGQEELDRVLGKNTLPTFEDRDKLPYVEAICKECLR